MIHINYNRLFNLKIAHTYYSGERVPGIQLQPTSETKRKLKGGNMLFKTISDGMVILYRAKDDEITPFIDLSPDLMLTFFMTIENEAKFQNITDLDESSSIQYSSSNILYFANNPAAASDDPENPEAITHELIDALNGRLFTYNFNLASPPANVLLKVRNSNNELVSTGKKADGTPLPTTLPIEKSDDGSFSHQIDFRGKPAGKYTFIIRNSADDTTLKEEVFYIDDELASRNIMGIVNIVYNSATNHLYDATEEYQVKFKNKETVWKYFIVNKTQKIDLSADDLSISDNGTATYPTVSFTREGPEPHNSVAIGGLDTVIFKSDVPIPFRDIPKTSIKLKNQTDNIVLIKDLPNPSHEGVVKKTGSVLESEIYVFI